MAIRQPSQLHTGGIQQGPPRGAAPLVLVVFLVVGFTLAVIGHFAVVLVEVALEALCAVSVGIALLAFLARRVASTEADGREHEQVMELHGGLLMNVELNPHQG